MKFYHIKDEYIAYLHDADSKVPDNKHEKRPFIGIVFNVNEMDYYVPLSSPKPKHKTMKNNKDFRKINGGEYGAINFNNMLPVIEEALIEFNIQDEPDYKYRNLLQNQYRAIVNDFENIKRVARDLYYLCQLPDDQLKPFEAAIKNRCCNFRLLETFSVTYLSESNVAATISSDDDQE
ncbi:MAG: type III toxin-antitoxin system ToxN/AbiQ family toxin [Clostridiales bacterium]|nr:type III toxin-antitoxin system ToxN/AbiQ family toxin [Clostridiales bacterium]